MEHPKRYAHDIHTACALSCVARVLNFRLFLNKIDPCYLGLHLWHGCYSGPSEMTLIYTKSHTYKQGDGQCNQTQRTTKSVTYHLKHLYIYLSVFYVDFNHYVISEAIDNYICLVLNDTYIFISLLLAIYRTFCTMSEKITCHFWFFIHVEHILLQIIVLRELQLAWTSHKYLTSSSAGDLI